jgi:uncharacterized Ntn-hydrolase superfamily protein
MTYSIVARDEGTGARGVAVASKAMCVGAHVPWGAAGAGALATQAWHDLRYGWEGLALIEAGHSAASTVQQLTHDDPDAPNRQLGIVDRRGRVASYTGSRCLQWAGGMCGRGYAVQGNLLAGAQVVEAMAEAYEGAEGTPFVHRLVHALLAGDEAGGDRRGRQSAAVKVWRGEPGGDPTDVDVLADLRVDDGELPVHGVAAMLPKLWLEYGTAQPGDALPLEGSTVARVVNALAGQGIVASTDNVETALEVWASEQNLESRLVPGMVDRTVLAVLESGPSATLARVAASPPLEAWPA